jgi:hypothetical protein
MECGRLLTAPVWTTALALRVFQSLARTPVSRDCWCSCARRNSCRCRGGESDAQPEGPRPTSPCRYCVLLVAGYGMRDDECSRCRALASRQPPCRAGRPRSGKCHHRSCRTPPALATLGACTHFPDGALLRPHADCVLRRQRSPPPALESPATACLLATADFRRAAAHCASFARTIAGAAMTGLTHRRAPPNKGMKQTKPEHGGASQPYPRC